MPLRVTFELSDRDLSYFRRVMAEVSANFRETADEEIVRAARRLLAEMDSEAVPGFVRERVGRLDQMISMLEDEEWHLEGPDRTRVVRALAYFAEPEDLIPDRIPGLGFLDDAIMVELVVGELTHELEAYEDFCRFRVERETHLGRNQDVATRENWLHGRRRQLQARMRRRRSRTRSKRVRGKTPFALW